MKTFFSIILALAVSLGVSANAQGPAEKAKDVAEDTVKGVKKAVKDATSHHINVTMTEYHFTMPSTAESGLTTFEIKNVGKKEHTFAIKGEGIDRKLKPNLKAGETATLQVNLKPGTYAITCPVDLHTMRGMKTTLTVK